MSYQNLMKLLRVAFVIAILLPLAAYYLPETSASPGVVSSTGILQYVPIAITNSQPLPTPAPFQQMITVNSVAYEPYEASNLQNVEFFYVNGTVVPSWLESGNSSSSTNTIYWLNIAAGIQSDSTLTVYMGFASPTTNLLNGRATGEAPTLSPSYGQYDDGAKVFHGYWNFAGAALPGSLTGSDFAGGTGSYTVNDGISISSSGDGYGVFTSAPLSSSYVIDASGTSAGAGGPAGDRPALIFSASSSSNPNYVVIDQGGFAYYSWVVYSYQTGGYVGIGAFGSTMSAGQFELSAMVSSSSVYAAATPDGGSTPYTYNQYSFTNQGAFVGIGTERTASGITFYWFRERSFAPNGIMPSFAFYAITTVSPTTSTSSTSSTTSTTSTSSTSSTPGEGTSTTGSSTSSSTSSPPLSSSDLGLLEWAAGVAATVIVGLYATRARSRLDIYQEPGSTSIDILNRSTIVAIVTKVELLDEQRRPISIVDVTLRDEHGMELNSNHRLPQQVGKEMKLELRIEMDSPAKGQRLKAFVTYNHPTKSSHVVTQEVTLKPATSANSA